MRLCLLTALIVAAPTIHAQSAAAPQPGVTAIVLERDSAPRFRDIRLRTGVRLRYAEQGNATGEAVVLLHGLSDSWFSYSRILPSLPLHLRVFALDQRGHGDSDRPASGYTVADFGEDVVAFLDAVGVSRATIVGHSMGAFVAQRVAIIAPERVQRLVLIGGARSARNAVVLGLQAELADLPDVVPDDFLRAFQYGTLFAAVPETFMERVIVESAKVPARVLRGSLDGLLASRDSSELDAIRAPTLIVWGEHDAMFSRKDQTVLQQALSGSDLRVYAGIGHAPHWEAPDRFVHDFLAFLARSGAR
jgi:pimeloyl-ACP methyl ester carboxylesterase